jgi:NADH-quinone oxidoreductase subunit I
MEPLSKRVKVLEKKPMTLAERAYLPAIFQGLTITMRHFFRAATKKQVTIRYPDETRPFSPVFRGYTC